MEGALAWISQLVAWIGQFIPRWIIVPPTHGAVKFVKGSRVVKLGCGIHWYWPVMTQFELHPTARQAIDLRTQTIVTADDRVIAVGGLIVCEISDVEAILARTFDPDQTIKDISMGVLHDVLCSKTWADIKAEQQSGALDRELRREVKKQLDDYGVKVLRTTLTDLAPCRVIKLLQTISQDGI